MCEALFCNPGRNTTPGQLYIETPAAVRLLEGFPGQRWVLAWLMWQQTHIDVIFGQWYRNPLNLRHTAGGPDVQVYYVGDRDLFTNAPRQGRVDYSPWFLPVGADLWVEYPAAATPPNPGDDNGNTIRLTYQALLL